MFPGIGTRRRRSCPAERARSSADRRTSSIACQASTATTSKPPMNNASRTSATAGSLQAAWRRKPARVTQSIAAMSASPARNASSEPRLHQKVKVLDYKFTRQAAHMDAQDARLAAQHKTVDATIVRISARPMRASGPCSLGMERSRGNARTSATAIAFPRHPRHAATPCLP